MSSLLQWSLTYVLDSDACLDSLLRKTTSPRLLVALPFLATLLAEDLLNHTALELAIITAPVHLDCASPPARWGCRADPLSQHIVFLIRAQNPGRRQYISSNGSSLSHLRAQVELLCGVTVFQEHPIHLGLRWPFLVFHLLYGSALNSTPFLSFPYPFSNPYRAAESSHRESHSLKSLQIM